ncbi:MAG: hypothetical protein L0Z50_06030, partial [Verrucomicrobiales bacterium]|nr:hypothetical protein [Verrucomicrobiales bacterium]
GRLGCAQFAVAVLSAAVVVVLFQMGWNPSICEAIEQLTEPAEIRQGELQWTGPAPQRLGRGSFVSFVVDPNNTGRLGDAADVEWILTRTGIRLRSLFGSAYFSYPANRVISLNRQELKPWWGAWRPVVYAGIVAACVGALFLIWWVLAALYVFPVRLISFYLDREVTWMSAWRLAGAAVLPGALFLDLAILGYALNRLNLLQLLGVVAAHFVVGWIYVIAGPAGLPGLKSSSGGALRPKNPFTAKA